MEETFVSRIKNTTRKVGEVPIIFLMYVLSVVSMNLLANKTVVYLDWVAIDGGIVISWLSFMCMDLLVRRFGHKIADGISFMVLAFNLAFSFIFMLVARIPTVEDFSAFNQIMGGTWFIVLNSSIAFIASFLVNNLLNEVIGRSLKKKGKKRNTIYMVSAYVSTAFSQFVDNFIFGGLTYGIFAPLYWGFQWSILQIFMSAVICMALELVCEMLFSPIGLKINKKWEEERKNEQINTKVLSSNDQRL